MAAHGHVRSIEAQSLPKRCISSSALSRWKFIAEVIRSEQPTDHVGNSHQCDNPRAKEVGNPILRRAVRVGLPDVSGRRFCDFGLLMKKPVVIAGAHWTAIGFIVTNHPGHVEESDSRMEEQETSPLVGQHLYSEMNVLVRSTVFTTLDDIQGFDNTGNVCVWPSEEILAFYCCVNKEQFRKKRICELGGGMTCLAGNLLAAHVDAELVLLTDGNRKGTANCGDIVMINSERLAYVAKEVLVRNLRWDVVGDRDDLHRSFDWIIAADCTFVVEYHEALLRCINDILSDSVNEYSFHYPKNGANLRRGEISIIFWFGGNDGNTVIVQRITRCRRKNL